MRKRASITVFSALAFALVASFLMALLEAGRVYQIQTYADMKSTLALESVCAEYQPVLWEEFHLLGLDGAYGGDIFSMDHVTAVLRERLDRNLDVDGAGGSILQVTLAGAEPVAYRLMTDQEGSVFLHCVAAYMKQNMAMETIRALQERYGEHEQVEQSGQGEESIEDARTAIEEAKSERREQAESDGTEAVIPELPPEQENPLEVVHAIKQNALLGMTLGDFGAVSTRQTDLGDSIERRQKQTGNMEIQVSDWYDRILALEYMDQYFGDYLGESEDHALAYELEYVLAGKGSDKENLESVITRLLFVREAANITHILGDGDKRAKTLGMAEALAGFTGNPAVVRLVQTGVIAAWAYVESILDIRALLAGDKIALIKTETQWTAQFGSLAAAFEDGKKAKNCENGVSYQGYLKGFLYTVSSERLAYRMMDIMERTVRLHPMYADCRMDHVLCGISYRMDYEWQPLFSGLMVHTGRDLSGLCYQTQRTFSYD